MKVIPLDADNVQRCVTNFHSYADEIRMNVPDIILATMECLHATYKSLKAEKKGGFLNQQSANTEVSIATINSFSALIPQSLSVYFLSVFSNFYQLLNPKPEL